MDYVYFAAKAVITAALCVLSVVNLTRQFQMLQQNSYFASRYFGWLKQNLKFCFANIIFILLGTAGGFFMLFRLETFELIYKFIPRTPLNAYIFTAIGGALLLATAIAAYIFAARAVGKNKKSIKPLVTTARIKRMYTTAGIISAVLGAAFLYLDGITALILWGVLLILTFIPALYTLIVLVLLKPAEKLIARHYVNDAKKTLKSSPSLTVVGITGSFGKTGTKFIIKRLLDEAFNVTATPGSFNTPMGVVRTVRENLRAESEIFLCEMGAKKKGDIKEICDIARPHIGIITSVGPQHLDTFGTIDTVADTKFELADAADEVFLNYDNEIIRARGAKYNTTSYGTTPDCDVYADNISYGSFGARFDVVCDGDRIPVVTKLLGKHSVLNITAGVAVAKRLGVSDNAVSYAVSRLTPTEHRLELKHFINGSLLIDDAYNANPEGCIEAVNVLASFDGRKKIIVTPGLVELGDSEYKYNYNLGLAAAEKCDIIILVGKQRSVPLCDAINTTEFKKENLYVVSSFAEALEKLHALTDKDTVTLIENDLPDNYLN